MPNSTESNREDMDHFWKLGLHRVYRDIGSRVVVILGFALSVNLVPQESW